MTVNLYSKYSIEGLSAELCNLIEFVLKYDFKNRDKTERKSSCHEKFKKTEKDETESLGKRNWKENGKSTRMVPYPVPLCQKPSSNGISPDKKKRFNVGKSTQSVSYHQLSNPTSVCKFNEKSNSNNDIDMHGRYLRDHIQELIFKIYSEQQTLEEVLRCKTQGRYKPRNPQCHSGNVLDQPPRFIHKFVSNETTKPERCRQSPDLFKFPDDGNFKEERFDALHVPYFEEKREVARELDRLFSPKLSNRINFI